MAYCSPRPTWGPLLIYRLAEKVCDRPFPLYPSTHFSPRPKWGPSWGPLSLYLLAEKVCDRPLAALVALPFGRFFASSHLGALAYLPSGRKSVRSALLALPFDRFFASSQLGGPRLSTLGPLSSYPSNPLVCVMPTPNGGPGEAPGRSQGPEGTPGAPRGPWAPQGPLGTIGFLGPLGTLGPEALRAGGLGKHGLALTRHGKG